MFSLLAQTSIALQWPAAKEHGAKVDSYTVEGEDPDSGLFLPLYNGSQTHCVLEGLKVGHFWIHVGLVIILGILWDLPGILHRAVIQNLKTVVVSCADVSNLLHKACKRLASPELLANGVSTLVCPEM